MNGSTTESSRKVVPLPLRIVMGCMVCLLAHGFQSIGNRILPTTPDPSAQRLDELKALQKRVAERKKEMEEHTRFHKTDILKRERMIREAFGNGIQPVQKTESRKDTNAPDGAGHGDAQLPR
jgi:hypothetical protein